MVKRLLIFAALCLAMPLEATEPAIRMSVKCETRQVQIVAKARGVETYTFEDVMKGIGVCLGYE